MLCGVAIIAVAPSELRDYGVGANPAIMWGLLFVIWGAAVLFGARRFRLKGLIASSAGGFMAVFAALLVIITSVAPRFTSASVADIIRPTLTSQAEVVSIGYIRSVPFYTRKRVKIFGPPDELELGVTQLPLAERREWFHEGANEMIELRETMSANHAVYCFMRVRKKDRKKVDKTIRFIGNGAAVIARNERYLVFGNRAALLATPPQRQTSENNGTNNELVQTNESVTSKLK
jgi:hypothetical protein